MRNINLFQYLSAFITIVLAIALTDLLMSLHRLIIARRRVRWSVLPLVAASYIFVSVVSEFFSIWVVADVPRVSFFYLLLLVAVPSVLVLAAFTVLPDEVPAEGLDLGEAYMANRVYLYLTLAVSFAGDLLRTTLHDKLVSGVYPWTDPAFLAAVAAPTLALIALYILLAWSRDRRVHAVGLLVFYAIALSNYLSWTAG